MAAAQLTETLSIDTAVERLKGYTIAARGLKPGKPDGAMTAMLQECVQILLAYPDCSDVVPPGLKFLEDVLTVAPQSATVIRLEGGVKLLGQVIRSFLGVDANTLILASRVLHKCCVISQLMQQTIVKEKGMASVLLEACAQNARVTSMVAPLIEVLAMLARYKHGAQQLSGDQVLLVRACKELLVGMMGCWHVFGMVVKLVKNIAKHQGPCTAILAGGSEVVKLLLGVTRLVAKMPEQRKLLKRTSRTLWILNQRLLFPLPDLEPIWPLPSKDTPHLNILTAMEADPPRHMELFPEDYSQVVQQQQQQQGLLPGLSRSTHYTVRTPRTLEAAPPSTSGVAAWSSTLLAASASREPFHDYGDALNADMMMHDLRRLVYPQSVLNRLVYINHNPSTQGSHYGAVHTVQSNPLAGSLINESSNFTTAATAGSDSTSALLVLPSVGFAGSTESLQRRPSGKLPDSTTSSFTSSTNVVGLPPLVGRPATTISLPRVPFESTTTTLRLSSAQPLDTLNGLAGPASLALERTLPTPLTPAGLSGRMSPQQNHQRSPSSASNSSSDVTLAVIPVPPRQGSGSHAQSSGRGGGSPRNTSLSTSSSASIAAAGPQMQHQLPLSALHSTGRALHSSSSITRLAATSMGGAAGGHPLETAVPVAAVTVTQPPAGGTVKAVSLIPSLGFDSGFEGGNLRAAVQVYDNEYDLFLAADINDRTDGGNLCQWFYFAVWNVEPGISYKFNVVNFKKKTSLFGAGKQPLVCKGQELLPPHRHAGGNMLLIRNSLQPPGGMSHRASSAALEEGTSNVSGQETSDSASDQQCRSSHESATSSGSGPPSAVVGWIRAGHNVAYYPSPYRGRTVSDLADPPSSRSRTSGTAAVKKGPLLAASASVATGRRGKHGTTAASDGSNTTASGSSSKLHQANGGSVSVAAAATPGLAMSDIGPGLYGCTFTLQFEEIGLYYVASCYPYGYTDLQEYLDTLTTRLHCQALQTQQQLMQIQTDHLSMGPGGPMASSALHGSNSISNYRRLGNIAVLTQSQREGIMIQQQGSDREIDAAVWPSYIEVGAMGHIHGASISALPLPPLTPLPLVRSLLCYTLSGHRCELLTVTDFSAPLDVVAQRECVVITARVHPGESCASWIMQGLLDFLTSNQPTAISLRSSFIFKLVPMLNPDGVVNGSYRCSLAGCDLNRVWDKPFKWLHPTVYHSKRMMQQLAGSGRLALYVDIHGHSSKQDVFFYGCEPILPPGPKSSSTLQQPSAAHSRVGSVPEGKQQQETGGGGHGSSNGNYTEGPDSSNIAAAAAGGLGSSNNASQFPPGSSAAGQAVAAVAPSGGSNSSSLTARAVARMRVRMLPYLASRSTSGHFSIGKCNFKIRKAKMGAARVVVNRELGVAGSYTLEASLGGHSSSQTHFNVRDYIMQGATLGRAIAELAEVDDLELLEEMCTQITLPGS
ncbi:hypothetical protein CEUSTIGMA_g3421.t1 [Chlamydomonas eustigma]|uniref:Peptidase M14 domain-containing protein n=1 Tax=Chlamydomonas eustigma TaxID=1157962 RepID=A0A250WYR4_9CHLO|nr:hypothetical protein CEUSTIGMA_g3421.t1 [Chlamydomonas eustigma]|eukprot:GAX75978.1 hypothetical protein CEUSTIGMA_g3421.t1 [Chlamydomonas eustigma]